MRRTRRPRTAEQVRADVDRTLADVASGKLRISENLASVGVTYYSGAPHVIEGTEAVRAFKLAIGACPVDGCKNIAGHTGPCHGKGR